MTTRETLYQIINGLSEDVAAQVLDYAEYLADKEAQKNADITNEIGMTDFEFKALLRMVLTILDSNKLEDARKLFEDLAKGRTSAKDATDNEE
jgi:hypothetical protein